MGQFELGQGLIVFLYYAEATDEANIVKYPAAVALDRLDGSKGGKARAEKLSPKRRKEIAVKAAKAR